MMHVQDQTSGPEDSPGIIAEGVEEAVDAAKETLETIGGWISAHPEQLAYVAIVTISLVVAAFIIQRFGAYLQKQGPELGLRNITGRTLSRVSIAASVFAGSYLGVILSQAPEGVTASMLMALKIAAILQGAVLLSGFLGDIILRRSSRAQGGPGRFHSGIIIVNWIKSAIVWAVAMVVLLATAGIDATALVAGLGIGGIAIGLAAQGMFADFFAGLSILFDKPFRRGDFIAFDDFRGDVQEVGLKTTRLRALSGEQIVIRNTNLLNHTIQNYQRLRERRWELKLGVTYDTPPEKLGAISGWVEAIVEDMPLVRFERAHLVSFGSSALEFEVVTYVQTMDFIKYSETRDRIARRIFNKLSEETVVIAFPTRTLHIAPSEEDVREDNAGNDT
ncbi:MAG: mechanosensitive ion channel family protein [Rhodobacterales bacterium CG15_BIG_FIL_POST_REV_8_21_14_020_59_13]|nr:MAG: mechanosensitive ion channel family protein [Rhodobacterales bacterium CG15_BIG_FIL_POST_REV_8_21_14_020_59_13]